MKPNHGLSDNELQTLRKILGIYGENINKVAIFGSRANGKYKEYSDIDLVIYGDLDKRELDRLNTLIDECNIGLSIDIKSYRHIEHLPLKRHIDEKGKILFSKKDLTGC